MVVKVLTKTGAMVRAQTEMYKAVVHMGILYKSNSWVMTETMLKVVK